MASVNKVILLGNVGRDPETRYTADGAAITNCSLATSERWKDKQGEMQEKTEWHRLVFFGKLAEIVGEYVKKGSSIYVEGNLTTRKWTNKDGVDQYTTEVRCNQLQMLNKAPVSEGSAPARRSSKPASNEVPQDDDIPF